MEAETREIQYTFSCAHMPARSLSDVQESAQFLAGEQLPATLVGGLLAKSKADGVANIMGLINLTPYEGWVEKACKKGISGLKFKTLSVTKNLSFHSPIRGEDIGAGAVAGLQHVNFNLLLGFNYH